MLELSLNVLDLAVNSITAGASLVIIEVDENTVSSTLTVAVSDNGCGMSKENASCLTDPFFSSKANSKVGLGVPLFYQRAILTGGCFELKTEIGKGTKITAQFNTNSVDFVPLGDMASLLAILVVSNRNTDFVYKQSKDRKMFVFDTRELLKVFHAQQYNSVQVAQFVKKYIEEGSVQ